MEVAVEVEDDAFFADLSKQISLLIMDDEEDLANQYSPSVSLQTFSQAIQLQPAPQSPFLHEISCKRESKGTGVFIPRLLHPRRKNRQGRYTSSSSNAKLQKHFDNARGLSHVPHNNNASYEHSLNQGRF